MKEDALLVVTSFWSQGTSLEIGQANALECTVSGDPKERVVDLRI